MMGEAEPSLPLEALQGEWVATRGETVTVKGTELSINGKPTGGLKISADGSRVVGFSIYKLQPKQTDKHQVMWHAGPQELIWRRAAQGEVDNRIKNMFDILSNIGQGLAAAANTGGEGFNVNSEREAVVRLNLVIEKWREGPLIPIRSCDICPDWTNRAQTGLSVDHVHYIATMIQTQGFISRRRGATTAEGAHDVPVLVRESANTGIGHDAVAKWREHTTAEPAFPPFLFEGKDEVFCSLGNGHFSQALNLFRTGGKGLWTGSTYSAQDDDALQEALKDGVESVVLSSDMPTADRRFVSEMLNRAHGRPWQVGDDGRVSIDGDVPAISGSQFVALSKVLDAEELSCLVRTKLGVDVDRRGSTGFESAAKPDVAAESAPRSKL